MPKPDFITFPSDQDLGSKKNWTVRPNNTYETTRAHIIVTKSCERRGLRSFPVKVIEIPSSAEYSVEQKTIRVIKYSEKITNTVQDTVTAKIASEISTKATSGVSLQGLVPTVSLSADIQAKLGGELTKMLQTSTATEHSFAVDLTDELKHAISYKPSANGSAPPRKLNFFYGLSQWRWDIYLYRAEFLRLRYRRNWLWQDVRDSMEGCIIEPKLPIASFRFYEPQTEYSFLDQDYTADVSEDDARAIMVSDDRPTAPMPEGVSEPKQNLVQLARLAFPQTQEERKDADAKRRKAAASMGVGPGATSRILVKGAYKKRASKKAASKSAPKSRAKKATARRGKPARRR